MPRLPKGMFARKNRPGWYTRVFRGNRERLVSLGSDFEKAKEKLREVREGRVMVGTRLTVRPAAEQWLERYVRTRRNERDHGTALQRWDDYLLEFMGHMVLSEVTKEDVRAYRQWLDRRGRPYGFVCRLGIGTGLRWGELVRLQSTDLQDGSLVVHHTKSRKIRRVPVAPELLAELRFRVGRLMPFTDGTGFSRQVRKLSKIERFYPHRMRHAYGCRLLASGVSLAAVKELLGHSSVLVTERYARLAESMVRREVERAVGCIGGRG